MRDIFVRYDGTHFEDASFRDEYNKRTMDAVFQSEKTLFDFLPDDVEFSISIYDDFIDLFDRDEKHLLTVWREGGYKEDGSNLPSVVDLVGAARVLFSDTNRHKIVRH